jgi:hypothetical protein
MCNAVGSPDDEGALHTLVVMELAVVHPLTPTTES